MPPQVALLYSPRLAGHRQVYCRVVGETLAGLGFAVHVATAAPDGADPAAWGQIEVLRRGRGARVHRVGPVTAGSAAGDWARLVRLARWTGATLVVLLEADSDLAMLCARRRPGAPALRARLCGLFLRSTNFVHESRAHGVRPAAALRDAQQTVRNGVTRDPWLFHRLFLPVLRPLDAALCLDEVFVAGRGARYGWLPDIYEAGDNDDSLEDGAGRVAGGAGRGADRMPRDETESWRAALTEFRSANEGRRVIPYVGASQARRGYDTLLKLALETDSCFIHCGRDAPSQAYAHDVAALRRELASRGALLETGVPFARFATATLFLQSAVCVTLPYRHHLGASGVLLQALAAGRPVLVPEEGLMAARVKEHGLGLTYRPGDDEDLRRRFEELHVTADDHSPAIQPFLRWYSPAERERSIAWAAGLAPAPAALPHRDTAASARSRS